MLEQVIDKIIEDTKKGNLRWKRRNGQDHLRTLATRYSCEIPDFGEGNHPVRMMKVKYPKSIPTSQIGYHMFISHLLCRSDSIQKFGEWLFEEYYNT